MGILYEKQHSFVPRTTVLPTYPEATVIPIMKTVFELKVFEIGNFVKPRSELYRFGFDPILTLSVYVNWPIE